MDMSELLILVLLEFGDLKMPKTHLVHQDIWLRKLCAVKTTLPLWIILLLVLWHMSVCMEDAHILENLEKKLEITFYQNRYK